MSSSDVTPAPPTPTQPYKALVATAIPLLVGVVVVLLNQFLLDAGDTIPPWLALVITAVVSGLGVFQTTNPAKTTRNGL